MPLAPPIRPLQCVHKDCTFPDGGTCALAAELSDPVLECAALLREDELTADDDAGADVMVPDDDDEVTDVQSGDSRQPARDAAPWAGRHLDRETADQLLRTSPARLVAMVGPYDAGKTSLLASFFLQLANGQCRALPYRFASSRTFHALHEISDQIQSWDQAHAAGESEKRAIGSKIVARTPKQEGPDRFLHLGLCPRDPDDRRHLHVLLSDVAGEWFSDYTTRADAAMRGRMAFLGRCDAFMVVADAGALMGRGGARVDADISRMIRRVCEVMQAQPQRRRSLVLVLSKFDRVVRDALPPAPELRLDRKAWGALGKRCERIWTALQQARDMGIPVGVFPVSAFPAPISQAQPVGVEAPFAFVLAHADARKPWPRWMAPVPEGCSSLEALRRWPAHEGDAP